MKMDKMPDREKVIKGLERCVEKLDTVVNKTHGFNCTACPYFRKCDRSGYLIGLPLMRDALALLKEHEPVEPIYGEDNYIRCGKCKHHIVGIIVQDTGNVMQIQKYCSECGRAVKWE